MTSRTTKEAYGVQLSSDAFRSDHDPDRPVAIGCIILAVVFGGLWAGGALADRYDETQVGELISHECRPVDSLANGRDRMLWHCRDGYRVSSTRLVDGS